MAYFHSLSSTWTAELTVPTVNHTRMGLRSLCLTVFFFGCSHAYEAQLIFRNGTPSDSHLVTHSVELSIRRLIPNVRTSYDNGFTYDAKNKIIYWASGSAIYREQANGLGSEVVINNTAASHMIALELDWVAQNIYYLDSRYLMYDIGVCSLQTRVCSILVSGSGAGKDIVLHPESRRLYWARVDDDYGISQVSMDGSFPTKKVTSAYYIERLAIDQLESKLYWSSSASREGIKSCSLECENATTVLSVTAYGFGVHDGDIYWVDSSQQHIRVAKNANESNVRTVVNGSNINNLEIMDLGSQPAGLDNPCEGQPCSHICVLASSGFRCLCPQGFQLGSDERTCKNTDAKAVWWSKSNGATEIQILSLNSSQYTTIPVQGIPGGLTYDGARAKIFWSYKHRDVVYQSNLDGSEREIVLRTGGVSVRGLAYDWIAHNIYYTDNVLGQVGVCSLNTKACTIAAQNDGWDPEDIALLPRTGRMYWLDSLSNSIMGSLLNGSSISVYEQRGYYSSISIEQYGIRGTPRIYLADPVNQNVWDAGSSYYLPKSAGSPQGVDCRYNHVYWTAYNSSTGQSSLETFVFYTDTPQTLFSSDPGQLWGDIVVVSPNGQPPNRRNHCGLNSCSHICTLNDKSYSCLCPEGLQIGEDGRTCKPKGE